MKHIQIIDKCPICLGTGQQLFLSCKDHTVSRETFNIVSCTLCGFKFTNPIPIIADLPFYYKSEAYISHSNTKKGLINRIYQYVRSYTILKKLQLITKINGYANKSKKILDIGCGTGEFLNACQGANWDSYGIEPSLEAAAHAQNVYNIKVYPEHKLAEFKAEEFDIITMWHVMEHIPELNERIKEIKRIIKFKGTLIVALPNCSSNDALYYKEFWAAYDVPRHLYHFTPKDVRKLFFNHNMVVKEVLPMRFDAFYVSMLSENYRSNGNLLNALFQGLKSNIRAIKTGESFSSQIYIIKCNA